MRHEKSYAEYGSLVAEIGKDEQGGTMETKHESDDQALSRFWADFQGWSIWRSVKEDGVSAIGWPSSAIPGSASAPR
jgi:hypothetical protein